jgi:XTP/dITP diphosphohydrolase
MDNGIDSKISNREVQLKAFDRLLTIMDELREKCPWDRKQTLESLRHLTIEETYELSDAILEGDLEEVKKEIGDLMLHLVFYSKIGSETGSFDVASVLNGICEKLIKRHPHIYPDESGTSLVVENEDQVKQNWEKLKLREGNRSVLSGVPKSLPALVKAIRIQEKARGAGFDWEEREQVWMKVTEELGEFTEQIDRSTGMPLNPSAAEGEFGDLLFSLVNYARFVDINPETALERTNKKFIRRFTFLEEQSRADGKELQTMSLAEMDAYWEKAKQLESED